MHMYTYTYTDIYVDIYLYQIYICTRLESGTVPNCTGTDWNSKLPQWSGLPMGSILSHHECARSKTSTVLFSCDQNVFM